MALAALHDPAFLDRLGRAPASSSRVSEILPGHQGYARVLSPARDRSGAPVTWRSLAGTALNPAVQWADLQGGDTPDLFEPTEGSIDAETAGALISLLEPRTTTPTRCVFLVWEGYAGLKDAVASAPKITVGFDRRSMHVLEGTLGDALESVEDEPSDRLPLWWLPFDRAWSVGGDLYGRSIYVGGTSATISALLSSPDLEALPVSPDHEVGAEDL